MNTLPNEPFSTPPSDDASSSQMPPEPPPTDTLNAKRNCSRLGWALFATMIALQMTQALIAVIVDFVAPNLLASTNVLLALSLIPVYVVGLPLFILMTKSVPAAQKGPVHSLPAGEFLGLLIVSFGATYLFNMFGSLITTVISLLKGSAITNPLSNVTGGNVVLTTLLMCILTPIVEETIFRGVLLDRLRTYGDKNAILYSALMFGLYHENLSQFFYAFVLGAIFAYIALKTNTLRYTIVLHMIINFIGSVVVTQLVSSNDVAATSIVSIFALIMIIAGIVLTVLWRKRLVLSEGATPLLPAERRSVLYGNAGTIAMLLLSAAIFVYVTLVS